MRSSTAAVVLVALLAGCGGSHELTVEVTPRVSLADEPVHVRIDGAEAGALVSVALRSTDAAGAVWRSSASFRADAGGRVELDRARPARGDYAEAWGMGLVGSLRPVDGLGLYAWAGARPLAFEVAARAPHRDAAAATFRRRLSPRPLARQRLSLVREGFLGEYVALSGGGRRPAVLVFGGSEGGLSDYTVARAATLAAHGYPALALAYFGEPGLPKHLYRIRLEYFERALRWLSRRPEVDPTRVLTFGTSRGSEAALLLGVSFPRLVYGAIAAVPSNAARWVGWTIDGKDIPSTKLRDPRATDDPRALIPAERIRGPVFAYCAARDEVWPSCPYARALAQRLRRHRQPHTLRLLDGAYHYAGALSPYGISSARGAVPTERAVERLWPRLLAFLREARR